MSNPEVGQPLNGPAQRDAIHVAIAPVVAARILHPGTPITFVDDSQMEVDLCPQPVSIGIVDPFLTRPVQKGEKFYMFVNPNTITALRHEWTHPAFSDEAKVNRALSEKWLRDFCDKSDGPSYEALMNVIQNGNGDQDAYYHIVIDQDYIHVNGSDAHGEIPSEFWDHVQIVTGKKPPQRPSSFSCAC